MIININAAFDKDSTSDEENIEEDELDEPIA